MGDPGAPTRIPDPRLQSYPESLASDVGGLERASERTFLVRGGPPTLSEGSLSSPRLIACPPPLLLPIPGAPARGLGGSTSGLGLLAAPPWPTDSGRDLGEAASPSALCLPGNRRPSQEG